MKPTMVERALADARAAQGLAPRPKEPSPVDELIASAPKPSPGSKPGRNLYVEDWTDQALRELGYIKGDSDRLKRHWEFFTNTKVLLGFLYASPWLYFLFSSLAHLTEGPIWHEWPAAWRVAVAALFALYHKYATDRKTGPWYAMEIWETFLSQKRAEIRKRELKIECDPASYKRNIP